MLDAYTPTSLTKMHSLFVLRSDFRMNTANELVSERIWWLMQAKSDRLRLVFNSCQQL